MEKKLNEYLKSIGINGAVAQKVEETYKFYSQYLGYQLDEIFVSEFINKDGSRVYENLWFFNSNFCFEAKLFNIKEDFDTDVIKDAVTWFTIKKTEFNVIDNVTNDNSRMFLEFGLVSNRQGDMKASKENCKQLSKILKTYIQPNYGSNV